ncbi:unnamed protein product, partial [Schistosoma curassoni]|uniref:Ovule protein n=1 Tax=Schistosoma curassoni TaxID=6186 RepID=A0A183JBJ2_9TREM
NNSNNSNSHGTVSECESKRRESVIDVNRRKQRELIEKQRVSSFSHYIYMYLTIILYYILLENCSVIYLLDVYKPLI